MRAETRMPGTPLSKWAVCSMLGGSCSTLGLGIKEETGRISLASFRTPGMLIVRWANPSSGMKLLTTGHDGMPYCSKHRKHMAWRIQDGICILLLLTCVVDSSW